MSHEQPHKGNWHHTFTQNLKAQVDGSFPHLYGAHLFHFYLMWDLTSHLYSNRNHRNQPHLGSSTHTRTFHRARRNKKRERGTWRRCETKKWRETNVVVAARVKEAKSGGARDREAKIKRVETKRHGKRRWDKEEENTSELRLEEAIYIFLNEGLTSVFD